MSVYFWPKIFGQILTVGQNPCFFRVQSVAKSFLFIVGQRPRRDRYAQSIHDRQYVDDFLRDGARDR